MPICGAHKHNKNNACYDGRGWFSIAFTKIKSNGM